MTSTSARSGERRRRDSRGRLDILAFRLVQHALPEVERRAGVPGLAGYLEPVAEALIADVIPPVNVLPLARRKLA